MTHSEGLESSGEKELPAQLDMISQTKHNSSTNNRLREDLVLRSGLLSPVAVAEKSPQVH